MVRGHLQTMWINYGERGNIFDSRLIGTYSGIICRQVTTTMLIQFVLWGKI